MHSLPGNLEDRPVVNVDEKTLTSDTKVHSISASADELSDSPLGAGEVLAYTKAEERRLVWKYDLRILPVLAVMYLFNSLDKSVCNLDVRLPSQPLTPC